MTPPMAGRSFVARINYAGADQLAPFVTGVTEDDDFIRAGADDE